MNYFAHGMRFVDRPYYLVGTALPDLLSVVDRRVRLRIKNVTPFTEDDSTIQSEVASGIQQHLEDDHWFHSTQGFLETSTDLSLLFRKLFADDEYARVGFLGHIVTELLLDGVLMDQNPGLIDQYYEAFDQIDPLKIEQATNKMATRNTDQLKLWLGHFSKEGFLRDYLDSQRLLVRLNQVMKRVKLQTLPVETISILKTGRRIVEKRLDDLLPPEHFESQLIERKQL
ncbi:hypothetical protein [uncultured Gimesia sp.]|uniref:hypothetical protein n=1 Tax=uncultured Gimesia sp. TaxID=1678688 RepID=UPI0030D87A44|tara:strand:+ start:28186 stop:28869 length:684 start_codon:yes stop_codon:yes gene_type:complete